MDAAAIDAFLAEPRHAVLATSGADGSPQISPVWYLHRDGKLYLSVARASAKYRNLQRDPRLSLCVDGGHPDARYVVIHGMVEFFEQPSPWRSRMESAIARRYHDSGEAAANDLDETADADAVLLAITPQKIFGHDYN
jgi:PPOX class probable F420-dependent enzyme